MEEEMTALTRLQWEYKLSSLPLFTQTWLTENTLDFVGTLDGIQPVRVDQSARESGKGEVEEPRTHYDESTKDIELLAFGHTRVPEPWFQCQKSHVPRSPTINRPVALISLLMKTKLRLILHQLRPLVSSALDLLQFAYQPGIRVDNGVIYLLHGYLSHLEQVGSTVRVTFFDFSCAFNTIRHALLRGKMKGVRVDEQLTAWTIDDLTNRPQS